MTNLFTYLSNWKRKYICALVVLLCIGVGNAWGGAAVGTVMWSENFGGYAANDVPSGSVTTSSTYRKVYNDGNVTYSCTNGTSRGTTKIYAENTAGGTSPEIMVCKYSGTFAIAGIPKAGATALTLTFKRNDQALTPTVSTGYSISKVSGDGKDTYEYTITCGVSETFTLTFTGPSGNKNVRLDDISVTVKTAGGSCTTNPTVTASGNSSVTSTTATLTCSSGISSLGSDGCSISSYGFVMNTTGSPTISDTKLQVGTTYTTTGTSFSKNLTDLTPGTTYYVCSYATNGNGTAYGSGTSFTTKNRYNLTFKETDGTNNGSGTVVEDSTAIRITSAPSKDYYDLEGFYTTSGLGTKIATAAGALQNGSGSGITVGGNAWTNGSSQWKRGAGETFYLNWTPKDYAITTTLSNCSWSSAISSPYTYDGTTNAITRTVNPSSNYVCPSTITVTMGGETLTVSDDYTWSVSEGVGSFTLKKAITGDVSITISAVRLYTITFNDNGSETEYVWQNGSEHATPSITACKAEYGVLGWTTTAPTSNSWASEPSYVEAEENITVSGDATYYAVYTEEGGSIATDNYKKISSSSELVSGDKYIITDTNDEYALDCSSGYSDHSIDALFISPSSNIITSTTSSIIYTIAGNNTDGYSIMSAYDNGTSIAHDDYALGRYSNAYADWKITVGEGSAVNIQAKTDDDYYLHYADSYYWLTTTATANHLYRQIKISYISNPDCCAKKITLSDPSITDAASSGSTITFNKVSPVNTCDGETTVKATLTLATGYQATALSFSGGSVSVSPTISTPVTATTEYTLTFAQNTNAKLTTSATIAAIPVSGLSLRVQQTGQDDNTGDDLEMTCYPKEGQTGNDPLEHTLKVLFNEVLPANALDKTVDWSVRVKAKGDADWTAVGFTSNALNSNSIINYFNKSTGLLKIASTEGTAEIKITAHDGSGVSAKVTITVANVSMTGVSVDPTEMEVYAGEKKPVTITFAPLNATNKAYTTGSYTYVTMRSSGSNPFYIEGNATSVVREETVTVTTTDGSYTATIDVTVNPLPKVTFADLVHNKTDFSNWGTDGVVSSTVTTGVVTHTKPAPSHSDISDPGSNYNTCERNHVHLVGWIRSDWADEHPSATHSQITSVGDDDAGNPYFYTAGADVDVEAQNGKTFYAVWSKIE